MTVITSIRNDKSSFRTLLIMDMSV